MTQTLPLRPRTMTQTTGKQAERVLRDMAYVLHLTDRIKREIRRDQKWPVTSPR